ncbi:MAG: hypothetical protein N2512_15745 [Armatimonadetes bacterium]|nr:hypothetical protein [Armatimonadota bacterium]
MRAVPGWCTVMSWPGRDTNWAESARNLLLADSDTLTFRGKSWATCLPASNRHNDGANCLFADGHVKWYRQDQVNEKYMNITWR